MQIQDEYPSPSNADQTPAVPVQARNPLAFLRMLDPSLMLTVVCTVIFYVIVHQPSMHGTALHRYTTEHIVEYAIVTLFIWASIDILFKCLNFPLEFRALRQEWLPPCRGREPISHAAVLLEQLRSKPLWQQNSRLGTHIREMLEVISEKGSAKDCRDDHNRLMEREDDRLHTNYILVRFVTGVTPILGFLGTVVHFGSALSGMSFDEMTAHLPVVVSEMGMAFNTTTVALAAAMCTMFLMFLCERIERSLMHSIERYVDREIVSRFESGENQQQLDPFLDVLRGVHETALVSVAGAMQRQFAQWSGHFEALMQSFHAHQEQASAAWQNALVALQLRQEEFCVQNENRLQTILDQIDRAEDKHLSTIQSLIEEAASFREELKGFSAAFDSMTRGEGKIAEVQETLSDNLRVLQQSGHIDDAMHGLTAAIHMLTARHRPVELDAAA